MSQTAEKYLGFFLVQLNMFVFNIGKANVSRILKKAKNTQEIFLTTRIPVPLFLLYSIMRRICTYIRRL